MVKENKGLTLIELIVSFAIIAIVGSMVFGFILAGTNQYKTANAEVNLQYEAQLTVNQIRELLIDATNGVSYSLNDAMVLQDGEYVLAVDEAIGSKVVCAYNSETTTMAGVEQVIYTATEIKWNDADHTLGYSQYRYDMNAGGTYTKSELVKDVLLAQYVTDFSIDLTKVETDHIIGLSLIFEIRDKKYETNHNITLRNKVRANKTAEEVFEDASGTLSPEVSSVVVTPSNTHVRAGTSFGGFTAKVIGKNHPIQDVEWSLSEDTLNNLTASGTYIDPSTGVLMIAPEETCEKIQVVATSKQSRINAGADTSQYVKGTATVWNTYINKENSITMSDIQPTIDLRATATVVIQGVNFSGTEDLGDEIQFICKDEDKKILNDIAYTVKRVSDLPEGTTSSYEVTFRATESYKDKKVWITAKIGDQETAEKEVTFRQKSIQSIRLEVKSEGGEWQTYRAGENRASKRGEAVEFRIVAIYEDNEEIMITKEDINWQGIGWEITFNGERNQELERRMEVYLEGDGILRISSDEKDFQPQSQYSFSVEAVYKEKNASATMALPKVSLRIQQAQDMQNAVGMVVGKSGNKRMAVISFIVEGMVAEEDEVQLSSKAISGVTLIRFVDANKYSIWVSEEQIFDLEFYLKRAAGVTANIRISANVPNVRQENEELPFYVPPANDNATFFKGVQWTYYDLYGNMVTYKGSNAMELDGTTYTYSLTNKAWGN